LQGVREERQYRLVKRTLDAFEHVDLVGYALAVRASEHYRWLRDRRITIRKTIDLPIATYRLENDMALLHADRDFDPLVQHLGLKIAHQAA
jgi:predicted nucleic acid-binding protein